MRVYLHSISGTAVRFKTRNGLFCEIIVLASLAQLVEQLTCNQ